MGRPAGCSQGSVAWLLLLLALLAGCTPVSGSNAQIWPAGGAVGSWELALEAHCERFPNSRNCTHMWQRPGQRQEDVLAAVEQQLAGTMFAEVPEHKPSSPPAHMQTRTQTAPLGAESQAAAGPSLHTRIGAFAEQNQQWADALQDQREEEDSSEVEDNSSDAWEQFEDLDPWQTDSEENSWGDEDEEELLLLEEDAADEQTAMSASGGCMHRNPQHEVQQCSGCQQQCSCQQQCGCQQEPAQQCGQAQCAGGQQCQPPAQAAYTPGQATNQRLGWHDAYRQPRVHTDGLASQALDLQVWLLKIICMLLLAAFCLSIVCSRHRRRQFLRHLPWRRGSRLRKPGVRKPAGLASLAISPGGANSPSTNGGSSSGSEHGDVEHTHANGAKLQKPSRKPQVTVQKSKAKPGKKALSPRQARQTGGSINIHATDIACSHAHQSPASLGFVTPSKPAVDPSSRTTTPTAPASASKATASSLQGIVKPSNADAAIAAAAAAAAAAEAREQQQRVNAAAAKRATAAAATGPATATTGPPAPRKATLGQSGLESSAAASPKPSQSAARRLQAAADCPLSPKRGFERSKQHAGRGAITPKQPMTGSDHATPHRQIDQRPLHTVSSPVIPSSAFAHRTSERPSAAAQKRVYTSRAQQASHAVHAQQGQQAQLRAGAAAFKPPQQYSQPQLTRSPIIVQLQPLSPVASARASPIIEPPQTLSAHDTRRTPHALHLPIPSLVTDTLTSPFPGMQPRGSTLPSYPGAAGSTGLYMPFSSGAPALTTSLGLSPSSMHSGGMYSSGSVHGSPAYSSTMHIPAYQTPALTTDIYQPMYNSAEMGHELRPLSRSSQTSTASAPGCFSSQQPSLGLPSLAASSAGSAAAAQQEASLAPPTFAAFTGGYAGGFDSIWSMAGDTAKVARTGASDPWASGAASVWSAGSSKSSSQEAFNSADSPQAGTSSSQGRGIKSPVARTISW